jgi:hypothetical protein
VHEIIQTGTFDRFVNDDPACNADYATPEPINLVEEIMRMDLIGLYYGAEFSYLKMDHI